MAYFCIGIVGYGQNPHVECFMDYARALAAALRTLGHDVSSQWSPHRRLIVFGANNAVEGIGDVNRMPSDAIIFNTEQVAAAEDPKTQMTAHERFKDHVIWDYSEANAKVIREEFGLRVVHCPFGYHSSMSTVLPAEDEDIDVLFYGSVQANDRRAKILDELEKAGLKVARPDKPFDDIPLFGLYGAERDAYVRRAKVVLNLHYYTPGIFEIFRVSHLVANAKVVVSESGGIDAGLENLASKITQHVPYEEIVSRCVEMVSLAPRARKAQGAAAKLAFMSEPSLVDTVFHALKQSEVRS